MNSKKNKIIGGIVAAVILILVIALVVDKVNDANKTQMELLSSGEAEYYENLYQKRYGMNVSMEEFLTYCVETGREQVTDERLLINYDCTLEDYKGVLTACKELRYINVSQEENFPDMLRISFVAHDGNEVLVSYADDMVWEWMVYDAAEDELITISELKWVKYTNYKKGGN